MTKTRFITMAALCAATFMQLWASPACGASSLGMLSGSSFGRSGVVFTGFGAHPEKLGQSTKQLVVEPDGKILLGIRGPFRGPLGPYEGFTVERLNANGTLDTSFGGDGSVVTAIKGESMAVQPNGSIVVAGSIGEGDPDRDLAVTRYLPSGKIDHSFGDDGIIRFEGGLEESEAETALQADGTIVVAARSSCGEGEYGCGYYAHSELVLMRLRPNGRLVSETRYKARDYPISLAVGSRDQIALAVETFYTKIPSQLLRFRPDGKLQRDFGNDGAVPIQGERDIGGLGLQPDDKLLLVGFGLGGGGIRRLEPDGTPDTSFGKGGTAECVPSTTEYVSEGTPRVAVLPDGRLLASGGKRDCGLVRYLPDGSLDTSFGVGGRLDTKPALGGPAEALAAGPNNTAILVKHAEGVGFRLVRYLADGTLDPAFGTGGVTTVPGMAATFDQANALIPLGKGKLLAIGTSSCASGSCGEFALARYRANGSRDGSFGHGGLVRTPLDGVGVATSGAVQPNRRIVIGGAIGIRAYGELKQKRLALARYMPGGALDSSFGNRGLVTVPSAAPGEDVQINAVAIAGNGDVVAVGEASCTDSEECGKRQCSECASFVVARFHSDGTPARGFGKDGVLRVDIGHSGEDHDAARAVAIQPDGKIVVAGRTYLGAFGLLRLLPNGKKDPTFGRHGIARTTFYIHLRDDKGKLFRIYVNRPATAMKLLANGKIVVTGGIALSRRGEGTHNHGAIARYLSNGKIDRSFGKSGSVDIDGLAIKALAIDRCGRLVLAGAFSSKPGIEDLGVTRRLPSGGPDRTFSKGIAHLALGTQNSHANAVSLSRNNIVAAGVAANTGAGNDFALAAFRAGKTCHR